MELSALRRNQTFLWTVFNEGQEKCFWVLGFSFYRMILILVVLNSYVLYVVGARIGLGIDLQSLPLVLAGVAIGKSNRKAFRSRLAHVTQVRQYEYQKCNTGCDNTCI